MKKKDKFIEIVHTLVQALACRHKDFQLEDVADVLGKAYKIEENDLTKTNANLSDMALEFIEYQLYITTTKPHWYTGEK